MAEKFTNNAQSTLSAAIGSGDTSLTVASASGFPTTGNFRILIDSEIILVGGVSGNQFTGLTRGAESTTAASHPAGALVTEVLTAGALGNLVQLAGQIGGTAESPDVRGLRETGGPTLLTMGAVSDGQFLKRSGSTIVGDSSSSLSITVTAAETISTGQPVAVQDDVGTTKAYLADADGAGQRGHSIGVSGNYANPGESLPVTFGGESVVAAGVWDGGTPVAADVGKLVYLSTTAGNVSLTPPTAGNAVPIGVLSRIVSSIPYMLIFAGQEVANTAAAANRIPKAGAGGKLDKDWYPDFVASGASHAKGAVPDPGVSAGTTKFLREDVTWAVPSSGMDINGLTAADPALTDEVPIYDVSAASNRKVTVDEIGGVVNHKICGGRLTLTSGTFVTTSDMTAAITAYFMPGEGDLIGLYDGTRWQIVSFTEQNIKLTDTQTGTADGTAVITNLTDTSQLVRGMEVTGTGVPANTTISSINSATQIALNNTVTSGTPSLTFKVPANKNVDVFGVLVSGALKLRFGNLWTNDTTRADALGYQNGVLANNAAINSGDSNSIAAKQGRYLGTVRTTSTAGQTEDSATKRFVWNHYNRISRLLQKLETTSTWTYNSSTYRNANGSSANRVEIVVGLKEPLLVLDVITNADLASGNRARVGIDEDPTGTLANDATIQGDTQAVYDNHVMNFMKKYPEIGYHTYQWIESSPNSATITFVGANPGGLLGFIMG